MKNAFFYFIAFTFIFLPALGQDSIPLFFNKPIDKAVLLKTYEMTTSELLAFIQSQGVKVFLLDLDRSDSSEKPSPILGNQKIQKRWVQEFAKDKVMGKFFSILDYGTGFTEPTILITDLNDKWTLLHEFMHFLFEKKRIELKIEDPGIFEYQKNAREDFLELSSKLRIPASFNEQNLANAISVFSQFMDAEIKLAGLLTLEEISIEKTISVIFAEGKIKNLTPSQKETADSYIKQNYRIISGQLESYCAIRDQLQKYLGSRKDPLLNATSLRLAWFRSELDKLKP